MTLGNGDRVASITSTGALGATALVPGLASCTRRPCRKPRLPIPSASTPDLPTRRSWRVLRPGQIDLDSGALVRRWGFGEAPGPSLAFPASELPAVRDLVDARW